MPPKKIRIVPAILPKNLSDFRKQWQKVSRYFSYLQIDIVDGIFVKAKTNLKPVDIKGLTRGHRLEIHLMVKNVPQYAQQWLELNNVKKIIWHYEANKSLDAHLSLNKYLRSQKIQTGLAINPATSLATIKDLIKNFSTIQIMSVTPGKQGQVFQKKALTKIRALRAKYPRLNIAVDGGISAANSATIKKAGANTLAVGFYLQNSPDIKKAIGGLR